jgi:hypothetical protein
VTNGPTKYWKQPSEPRHRSEIAPPAPDTAQEAPPACHSERGWPGRWGRAGGRIGGRGLDHGDTNMRGTGSHSLLPLLPVILGMGMALRADSNHVEA